MFGKLKEVKQYVQNGVDVNATDRVSNYIYISTSTSTSTSISTSIYDSASFWVSYYIYLYLFHITLCNTYVSLVAICIAV